jgi:hypothetical protein
MARGVVARIWRSYRDPRGVMAARIAEGLSEPRALGDLFLACGLAFVASMPNAVREARDLAIADPVAGVVSAHLFGYLFVAPLLFYGLAAVLHLVAGAFGGTAGFLGARTAVFWAAVLGGPIALGLALMSAVSEVAAGGARLPWGEAFGYVGFAFWLWLLAASLAEAEGFRKTYRVAAALAIVFAGVALGVWALSGTGLAYG